MQYTPDDAIEPPKVQTAERPRTIDILERQCTTKNDEDDILRV